MVEYGKDAKKYLKILQTTVGEEEKAYE